jgi:hypothetical protein
MPQALEHECRAAAQAFLARRIVPIVCEREGRRGIFGSGLLVRSGGDTFLVTAQHVVAEIVARCGSLRHLAVPVGASAGSALALGRCEVLCPASDARELDADVCALRLTPRTAERLSERWTALQADAAAADPTPLPAGDRYLIAGYPAVALRRHFHDVSGALYRVQTQRLAGLPGRALAPVHARHDLFFRYGYRGLSERQRGAEDTPPLEGLSGAPVWRLLPAAAGTAWSPHRHLRLAGVQTSYLHSSFIRAKNWSLVASLLNAAPRRAA